MTLCLIKSKISRSRVHSALANAAVKGRVPKHVSILGPQYCTWAPSLTCAEVRMSACVHTWPSEPNVHALAWPLHQTSMWALA